MKFKRSLIIICIIICLFSISSVSANEINDTATTIANADDGIIASSQEDVVSNTSAGTFTDLQNQILLAPEGGTINLDKDYVYDEGFSTKGITIAKDLTINGNGHTLNGLSKSRIFIVKFGFPENNKVTLNNIKFTNGYTKLYGGAIFNYGNLTVSNCTFTDNHADCCGGAINSVGHLNTKNSVFNQNSANGDGGAILCLSLEKSVEFFLNYYHNIDIDGNMDFALTLSTNATLKYVNEYVTNCTFRNNIAKGHGGGAIYAFGHITVDSSLFSTNTAGEMGGAVYGCKDLFIMNSKFYKNQAPTYGGAVYFRCHQQLADYVNNTWVYKTVYYTNLIQSSNFTKNSASKGGAIYGFLQTPSDKIHCAKATKCIFTDNTAPTGRDIYGGTTTQCIFNYLKLTLNTVNVKKSAKILTLTATLKKGVTPIKNKVITFKFNGKTYKAKTNSKGVAKVTIKKFVLNKLKVGKKVTYQASYNKLIVKKTANVKK